MIFINMFVARVVDLQHCRHLQSCWRDNGDTIWHRRDCIGGECGERRHRRRHHGHIFAAVWQRSRIHVDQCRSRPLRRRHAAHRRIDCRLDRRRYVYDYVWQPRSIDWHRRHARSATARRCDACRASQQISGPTASFVDIGVGGVYSGPAAGRVHIDALDESEEVVFELQVRANANAEPDSAVVVSSSLTSVDQSALLNTDDDQPRAGLCVSFQTVPMRWQFENANIHICYQ